MFYANSLPLTDAEDLRQTTRKLRLLPSQLEYLVPILPGPGYTT